MLKENEVDLSVSSTKVPLEETIAVLVEVGEGGFFPCFSEQATGLSHRQADSRGVVGYPWAGTFYLEANSTASELS